MDDVPANTAEPAVFAPSGCVVPVVVAVTGHRDLVAAELPDIRGRLRTFFRELQAEYPEGDISLMSGLAEGGDRLAADVALELGIRLIAALPMQADDYVADFGSEASRRDFRRLCDSAAEVFELPPATGTAAPTSAADARALRYAQLGVFLCAHCHILLALWDGKYNDSLGGTGQVVRFHHDDVMPGFTRKTTASRLILADDESDLVYHVVCSRDRADGRPADGLSPLDWHWFTAGEGNSRTKTMPSRHRRVFDHLSEFNRDARVHEDSIREGGFQLAVENDDAEVPRVALDIDHVFRTTDWLAMHFQKRTMFALQSTHLLALLMGLAYIVYSDLMPLRGFVIAFVGFFLLAAGIHMLGRRRGWHRKYLDYRTLAEGLRVQFYWAVAGVTGGTASKFPHDNFLQMQDPDLGWIRNVMRVAGTRCDVSPNTRPAGLAFALREWIGDAHSGQLGYYRRKAEERHRRHRRTSRLALFGLWGSTLAVGLFIFAPADVGAVVRDPIVVLMGVLLLIVGVRQSYTFSRGDAELIKQYEFMYRIFTNARRRIGTAGGEQDRRQVLRALGEAALEEHAEWILMHRDRSLDRGEIWRMSS